MPFKIIAGIIILLLFGTVTASEQAEGPPAIGLALRGGGALGFAHIGALYVIDSLQIPIDYIAGTSMGGLIGGLYAIGYSPAELEDFVMRINWETIFVDKPAREYLPHLIKKNTGKYQLELAMDGFSPVLPDGLVAGQKIYELIFSKTYLYEGIDSFDDLPIPYRCVGSDLVSSKEVVFRQGSLAKAMRATMSIPTVFDPIRYGDSLIVDGGMLNNFPVDVVKEMGADFVIGLNLVQNPRDRSYYDNLLKILDRTMDLPREKNLQRTIDMADLLINQDISGFALSDFDTIKIRAIINQGRIAAYKNIEQLKNIRSRTLVNKRKSDQLIKKIDLSGSRDITRNQLEKILRIKQGDYLIGEALQKRVDRFNQSSTMLAHISYQVLDAGAGEVVLSFVLEKIDSPRLKSVQVDGNVEISEKYILNFLGLSTGQSFDQTKFNQNITLLYGLGFFKEIGFILKQYEDRSISLTLQVTEQPPRKFLFGLYYDSYYQLVGSLGFRSHSTLLKGLYLESDIQFAGLTRFSLNLYYPSRSFDLPVYPILSGGYQDLPFDVYDSEGSKIFRYNDRGWYFGGGIGLSPAMFLNLEGKLLIEYPDIIMDIGGPDIEQTQIKDKLVTLSGDLDLDMLDNVLVPRNGLKISAAMNISIKDLGSDYDLTRVNATLDYYHTFSLLHTIRLFAMYMRSWHDQPFYRAVFFIGGPQTFIGLDYFQAFGLQFSLFRTEYRYEFLKNMFVKALVNSAYDYKLGFPEESITGAPFWGYGFSLMYSSILGPFELWLTWGDKTPYDPGVVVSRIYFTAGFNL